MGEEAKDVALEKEVLEIVGLLNRGHDHLVGLRCLVMAAARMNPEKGAGLNWGSRAYLSCARRVCHSILVAGLPYARENLELLEKMVEALGEER